MRFAQLTTSYDAAYEGESVPEDDVACPATGNAVAGLIVGSNQIIARPAMEEVRTQSAEQVVIACAAVYRIVTRAAINKIIDTKVSILGYRVLRRLRGAPNYSRMFASRITFAYLASSARMSALNSSGVLVCTS